MKKTIKVMTADDSAVVRRILKEVLEKNELIEVVYQARDGADAIGHFAQSKPDVVVLDVEMPIMSGLEAAAAIKALDSNVPIIMFSAVTVQGAETTLDALSRGASDYITKPSMVGHLSDAKSHISDQLVPKIISWGQAKADGPVDGANLRRGGKPTPTSDKQIAPFDVITVGVSTGGPEALKEFLAQFPADFSCPIVIVQHMPPVFTRILAQRLDATCLLNVSEAEEGSVIEPGKVLIAPGDFHMEVVRDGLKVVATLNQNPMVNFCRPAVDNLFKSVVKVFGKETLGVILTGMGADGLNGCKEIREKGGQVMAQDSESSSVWGMPGAVADAQLVSCLLPPAELAKRIVENSSNNCLQD